MGASEKGGEEATMSWTDGVKPMAIAGRMAKERERTSGMNAEERAWRKQWLKDQYLDPSEPLFLPKNNPHLLNPIRRAYRYPLDVICFKGIQPFIGEYGARVVRLYVGRSLLVFGGVYLSYYYFKYNTADWSSTSGWNVTISRKAALPGDENYPHGYTKKHHREYNDRGFMNSIFGKKWDNSHKHLDDDGWAPPMIPFTDILQHPNYHDEESERAAIRDKEIWDAKHKV